MYTHFGTKVTVAYVLNLLLMYQLYVPYTESTCLCTNATINMYNLLYVYHPYQLCNLLLTVYQTYLSTTKSTIHIMYLLIAYYVYYLPSSSIHLSFMN